MNYQFPAEIRAAIEKTFVPADVVKLRVADGVLPADYQGFLPGSYGGIRVCGTSTCEQLDALYGQES
jgi:hypothetical protein